MEEKSYLFISSLVLLLPILLYAMGLFSRKNQFVVSGRTVLLTGGSQGMGRGIAKLLAQKGANVIIVARDVKKLEAAVEYIKLAAAHPESQRFHYISADLTDAETNKQVFAEATEWNGGSPPDIVWANAGYAHPTLFIDTPIETLRDQMDVNYWAAAYLMHTTLNAWIRSPLPSPSIKANESSSNKKKSSSSSSSSAAASPLPRHFIITSSVISFLGLPSYSPYAPAKAAERNLSDMMHSELNLYNGARKHAGSGSGTSASAAAAMPEIRNHVVFPGTILTPGLEAENRIKHASAKQLEESDPAQTEDQAAASAIAGLEKGEYMVATQWLAGVLKCGSLGGSPRNGWGVLDTLTNWVASLVWLYAGPDMEKKVWKWGKDNGMS